MLQVLKVIWQSDGTFPSGSFAFSYGIEGLVAAGALADPKSLQRLIETILRHRWVSFDRVALVQAYRANGNLADIARIDRGVEAATFGDGLRSGSKRNGASFLATHCKLGTPTAVEIRNAVRQRKMLGHIAVMQGAIWRAMNLDEKTAQAASAYVSVAGAASTAVRLGVVGALQAQIVLGESLPLIDKLIDQDVADDDPLSSFTPFLDIASARHDRSDLRLFAN